MRNWYIGTTHPILEQNARRLSFKPCFGGSDFPMNSASKLPNLFNNIPKLTLRQINLMLMSWAVMEQ